MSLGLIFHVGLIIRASRSSHQHIGTLPSLSISCDLTSSGLHHLSQSLGYNIGHPSSPRSPQSIL